MNKCIIYIKTYDLQRWNDYMWNLRINEPAMPPQFKTTIKDTDEETDWLQLILSIEDLSRIYDLMDEYAKIVENFSE